MLVIPTPNESYADVKVSLNGETFIFTYRFNSRSERWKLDIADSLGYDVCNGLTIVENQDLTTYISQLDVLGGMLFTIKTRAGDDRIGRDNLGAGKTHQIMYISDAELAE